MRPFFISILMLSFSFGLKAQKPAPDFTLTSTDGTTYNLYEQLDLGKTVVLDFFMISCGSCATYLDSLDLIWETYGYEGDSTMVWGIEINQGTDEEIDEFFLENGGTFPAFNTIDDEYITDTSYYDVTYTPKYFVICPDRYFKYCDYPSIAGMVEFCKSSGNDDDDDDDSDTTDTFITEMEPGYYIQSLFAGKDQLKIDLSLETGSEITAAIYGINGRKHMQEKYILFSGDQQIRMNTKLLSSGFYILKLYTGQGKIFTAKFIQP